MATHREAKKRVERGFWIHFGVYGAVNAGLAALNLMRNPSKLWFPWVVGGWGLGVLLHGVNFFVPLTHRKMINRTKARMEQRKARR